MDNALAETVLEIVEQIVSKFAPPRPTPAGLRPAIAALITTPQTAERRTSLRAYYLDKRPVR